MLEVSVKDHGVGMTPKEAKNVFEAMRKAETRQDKLINPLGNRLGLSICKQICLSLGGTIQVKSVPKKGSKFTFTMKVFPIGEASE